MLKIHRLVTGEDIIGESTTKKGSVVIKDPLKVIYMHHPKKPGSMLITMAPWMVSALVKKKVFSVHNSHVMFSTPVSKEVEDRYKEFEMSTEFVDPEMDSTMMSHDELFNSLNNHLTQEDDNSEKATPKKKGGKTIH